MNECSTTKDTLKGLGDNLLQTPLKEAINKNAGNLTERNELKLRKAN